MSSTGSCGGLGCGGDAACRGLAKGAREEEKRDATEAQRPGKGGAVAIGYRSGRFGRLPETSDLSMVRAAPAGKRDAGRLMPDRRKSGTDDARTRREW